jgi:hypothetical protein
VRNGSKPSTAFFVNGTENGNRRTPTNAQAKPIRRACLSSKPTLGRPGGRKAGFVALSDAWPFVVVRVLYRARLESPQGRIQSDGCQIVYVRHTQGLEAHEVPDENARSNLHLVQPSLRITITGPEWTAIYVATRSARRPTRGALLATAARVPEMRSVRRVAPDTVIRP